MTQRIKNQQTEAVVHRWFSIYVLKHFAISIRKYLCWSLFEIKLLLKSDSNSDAFL